MDKIHQKFFKERYQPNQVKFIRKLISKRVKMHNQFREKFHLKHVKFIDLNLIIYHIL